MQFVNIIKPTHICNLDCTYCYNDDVRDPIMKDGTLFRTIEQTFAYVREHTAFTSCEFIWHGGEPTVAGLPFYQKAVALQKELSNGIPYSNSIQTNGVLINDKWIEFLRENDFAISISVDGPPSVHDAYRKTHLGAGSFERVFRAVKKVRDSKLDFGVCAVLSKATKDHVEEMLEFFVKERLQFNVIPMTKSGSAREKYEEIGLEQNEYADAWIRMYDAWLSLDEADYVYCQDFVLRTRAVLYGRGAECTGLANCSHFNMSTDPIGDVYPCGSVSGNDAALYGNLVLDDLDQLMTGNVAAEFRNREVDPHCAVCKWQHVCHGGCVTRSFKFFGEIHQRDYYCPSLYRIYEHIELRLSESGISPGMRSPVHMLDGVPEELHKTLQIPRGSKRITKVIPIRAGS